MQNLNQTQFNFLINSVYKLNNEKRYLSISKDWDKICKIEQKMEKQRIHVDTILNTVSNISELQSNAPRKFRHAYYLLKNTGGSNPFITQ